jgi:hypothetical protein
MKEQLVTMMLQIQIQFKILHWQTFSEARHVAYGNQYNSLGDHIDEFVEVMMGKYGRFQLPEEGTNLQVFNLKALEINSFLDTVTEFFINMTDQLDARKDTDLLNIRDEMLGDTNKLKYLLTQK